MAGQGQGGKSGALQQRQKPVPHRLGEVQGSGQGRQQLARFHSTEGETEASEHESCSAHTHGLNAAVEAASPSSRSPICGAHMAHFLPIPRPVSARGGPFSVPGWECACRRASGRAQGSHKGPAQHPAAPLSWPSQVLFSPRGTYPVESLVSGLSGTSEMTCTAPCPCLSQGRAVTPCRHSLRDGPGQASGLRSLHSVPLKPLLGARGLPRSQG